MNAAISDPILRIEDLAVTYARQGGGLHQALHPVSVDLQRGETLGVVGESGSGKSTFGRAVIGLTPAAGGRVLYRRNDLLAAPRGLRLRLRRTIQMVFQDPYSSLNPARRVGTALDDVLRVAGVARAERLARAQALIAQVGLDPAALDLLPAHFSGGQRQRIAIARALAAAPDVVIADEPISALDVSVQAQVLNLLTDLRRDNGLTMIFISHDLRLVSEISDRVAVLYLGRLVELAPARRIALAPAHPYSEMLFQSVALPDVTRARALFRREAPAEAAPVALAPAGPGGADAGCAFAVRCPHARDLCLRRQPPAVALAHGGTVLCHFPLNIPMDRIP
jgi:oligopeptide/dipeptide ABC transporter ATP-binding protein